MAVINFDNGDAVDGDDDDDDDDDDAAADEHYASRDQDGNDALVMVAMVMLL